MCFIIHVNLRGATSPTDQKLTKVWKALFLQTTIIYIYICTYQLSLIVQLFVLGEFSLVFLIFQCDYTKPWCLGATSKEVGWGWTSTMKIMDLKITVDSSGEDELVRNPSSSSVLMQQLSSVKTAWFWGWSGGGRYGKHLTGWDLVGSKDVGEILLTVAKGEPRSVPSCSRCNMLQPTSLLSILLMDKNPAPSRDVKPL